MREPPWGRPPVRSSRVSCWRLGADHDTYDVRVHDHAGLVAEPPDRDRDHETDREVDRAQALVHARHAVLHGLLGRGGKDVDPVVDEEQLDKVAEDLLNLEGMDKSLAAKLARNGVCTRDDLADLAVDELTEMIGIDAAAAGVLITTARAHWFADEQH